MVSQAIFGGPFSTGKSIELANTLSFLGCFQFVFFELLSFLEF